MSDSFFETSEVEDIALEHIENVTALESKDAQRILKIYKRLRSDLRDRLDMVPPGTFTEQKLKGVLAQVDSALYALSEEVTSEMGTLTESISGIGVENIIKELKKFENVFTGAVIPINVNAAVIASYTSNLLLSKYDSSVKSYSQFLRSRIASGLTESIISQNTLSEVISKINQTLMGEEWKSQQIVRTELHNAYNLGKLNTMTELWGGGDGTIPDLKKTLFHPMDHRTGKDSIRLNANNPIVPVDEPFVESSTGRTLEYMAPPNRPNDRAILIPYRESWRN